MTALRAVKLLCDFPECYARLDRGHLGLSDARKEAAAEGWKSFGGLIDLCGPVDKAPSWAITSNSRLHDHASGEHLPVVKAHKGSRKEIDLSCTCGWDDRAPWLGRGTASYRWERHLRPGTAPIAPEVDHDPR